MYIGFGRSDLFIFCIVLVMSKLQFTVVKQQANARVWELTLNGVKLQTPVFMPVWTKGTIKWMILDMLQDPKYIGDLPMIKIILANTFHLYLRPGEKIVKEAGWLHQFENWRDGLILTDSGGFQVFSLGLNETQGARNKTGDDHVVWVKLHEDGGSFCSPHDGSKHFFGPEKVVDIQCDLGSDIMMMLDVCSPAGADKATYAGHMALTHARARRQFDHMEKKYADVRGVLFPIVQGGSFLDLREESIAILSSFATDGIAVWGVSVWEEEEMKREVIDFCGPRLPADKPRYLMGVGTPEDLLYAVEQWFDMFDCVLATRLGRHGTAFAKRSKGSLSPRPSDTPLSRGTWRDRWKEGGKFERIKLRNAQYRDDFWPLTSDCGCFTCRNYSRAYLHHLVMEKEMLAGILLSLHNIVFLHGLLEDWKRGVMEG